MRSFKSLNEKELLALAISLEEEDARIFGDFADALKADFPAAATQFEALRAEEDGHRHRLLELYRAKFGDHIPLIRRQDVKGFVKRTPVWLVRPLGLATVRKHANLMEAETRRFYEHAAGRATDVRIRQLLGDLAEEERKHHNVAESMEETAPHEEEADTRKRLFLLQVVQPGLAGLMDGSVSTLAPLFAAAFATGNSLETLRVGLAASLGAGISMGFAEALSDDGTLTGRGRPLMRGFVCGLMTALGGLGHSLPYVLPYLIPGWNVDPKTAVNRATTVAVVVVLIELGLISWIRHRYMDTPWTTAIVQVVVGGALVFLAGILIGSS